MLHVVQIGEVVANGGEFHTRKFVNAVGCVSLPELDEVCFVHSQYKPLVVHDVVVDNLGQTYGKFITVRAFTYLQFEMLALSQTSILHYRNFASVAI